MKKRDNRRKYTYVLTFNGHTKTVHTKVDAFRKAYNIYCTTGHPVSISQYTYHDNQYTGANWTHPKPRKEQTQWVLGTPELFRLSKTTVPRGREWLLNL